jgi:hypothetical protein
VTYCQRMPPGVMLAVLVTSLGGAAVQLRRRGRCRSSTRGVMPYLFEEGDTLWLERTSPELRVVEQRRCSAARTIGHGATGDEGQAALIWRNPEDLGVLGARPYPSTRSGRMSYHIVELAPFKVAREADENELLAASETLQVEFLAHQPGFVRRELLRGKEGRWVDLVVWTSREAAEAAVIRAGESPACFRYFQLMEGANHHEPGADVEHYEAVKTYTSVSALSPAS